MLAGCGAGAGARPRLRVSITGKGEGDTRLLFKAAGIRPEGFDLHYSEFQSGQLVVEALNGGSLEVPGLAKFNVWSNAVSTGGFAVVAPGGSDTSNTIAVNSAEFAVTPAKGLMVVTLDNASGEPEAQLIDLNLKK